MALRIHIGHHFFGAGNIGDDLMLAGFLREARSLAADLKLSCCIPFALAPMQLRFPQVDWLPYEPEVREAAIERCDAWLGLGDTPFQTVLGDWMLDHLLQEAAWAHAHGKQMFYLGVGGDSADLATHPKARLLATQAARIWTRDRTSAALLRTCAPHARIEVATDLAHLWLAVAGLQAGASSSAGLVLNFEQREQATAAQLSALVRELAASGSVRWLAQEVRPLAGSETVLHEELAPDARIAAPLVVPDYAGQPDVAALLTAWNLPGRLLTSRYHAALIGAWAGCSTVVYPRSLKVRSAVDELRLVTVGDFADPPAIADRLRHAPPAEQAVLRQQYECARRACAECLSELKG